MLRGKLFSPIFAFSIAFSMPIVELQDSSTQETGLVPSQANKPNGGDGGQGMQCPRGLEPKGELKLRI